MLHDNHTDLRAQVPVRSLFPTSDNLASHDLATRGIACALILAIVAVFLEPLGNLITRWNSQEELGHSYFIPIISGWMLWECRAQLIKSIGAPSALGPMAFALSLAMLLLGRMIDMFFLQHLAFWVAVAGVFLVLGGRSLLWAAWFPVFHLGLMIPPPHWVITVTSWQFQLWSSELGVWMIRLFDIPVLLQGNVIDLGVTKLQVVEACSGLRYLFPFFSIALIASYLYQAPLWQRVLVFFSAIPITILMNSARIAFTGILSASGDTSHTEGVLHFFEGWVVFLLCIGMLLCVIAVLSTLTGRKGALRSLTTPHVFAAPASGTWTPAKFKGIAIPSIVLTGAGIIAVYLWNPQPEIPERAPLSNLVFSLHEWKPRSSRLDVAEEQVLGADDYIVTDLTAPNGEYMNLYIAYLEAQRDGNSWHSPRQCLPGGGWDFTSEETIDTTAERNRLGHAYNRIVMRSGGARLLVYYWYEQRGRIIADELAMNAWLVWDIATRQRADGAMVRIMTLLDDGERPEDADERLVFFANNALRPRLSKYIPD